MNLLAKTLALAIAAPALCLPMGAPIQGRAEFPADPQYAVAGIQPADAVAETARLKTHLERGARRELLDLVFVGKIRAVGKSPGISSGVLHSTQPVLYEVQQVLTSGPAFLKAASPETPPLVVVHHTVLGPPPGSADKTPRIDPALFHVGARLVLGARLGPAAGMHGQPALMDLRYLEEGSICCPATAEAVRAVAASLAR